jgi:hypothetical protein
VPSRWHVCPVCKSRLTVTVESAQRIGALGGLVAGGILVPLTFIADVETVRSRCFWACWIPFAYILGAVITMLTAKLGLYDDVRCGPRWWQIFPNVPARPRRFLIVSGVVVIGASMLLILPWSPPLWLEIALELAICVAGVFGLIGTWHLLFGARGIFRRSS